MEDAADLESVLTLVLKGLKATVTTQTNVLEVQRKVIRNHGDEVRSSPAAPLRPR